MAKALTPQQTMMNADLYRRLRKRGEEWAERNEHGKRFGQSLVNDLWPTIDGAIEGVKRSRQQVGWVRFDGDEFHDFRYHKPGEPHPGDDWHPVWVQEPGV